MEIARWHARQRFNGGNVTFVVNQSDWENVNLTRYDEEENDDNDDDDGDDDDDHRQ